METIFTIIITLGVTVFAALYWGQLLSVKLPEWDCRFDAKPFNCRPCLTFHIVWVLSTVFALVLQTPELFVYGLIMAFVVFFTVKHIDNKKVTK